MELNNLQNVAIVTYELEQSGCLVNGVTLASDTSFRHEVEAVPMSLKLFPNTRYRYNTRFLRVSTVATGLCAMVSVKGEMDDIPFTGYCIGALRVIAKHLNLTLVYVKARDNTWGWVDDGMMGQLQRKEIDLVASLMTVHATRAQHVDFIEPYLQANRVVLLYKMPPAAEPIFLLTRPFQASVYMTYVGVTLAVTLVWLVIERCDGFTSQMQGQSVCSLCWNVVRPLLRQGDSSLYITKPGRVLMTSWWLLVIIMSALYCGNLTATLSGAASFKKFQTIEEMINSDFTVGYRPGSSLEQKLKVSTSASVRRLYAKINRDNATDSSVTADSFDVHFQRVQGGSYAFVAYETVVYMFNRSDCSTSVLPLTDIQQESVTFAVQKNSPFKDDINKVMHALIAGGILTKMKTDSEDKPEGLVCSRRELRVTFTQMIGGLVAGGVGVGLASVCLITEWAHMHVTSTRNFT